MDSFRLCLGFLGVSWKFLTRFISIADGSVGIVCTSQQQSRIVWCGIRSSWNCLLPRGFFVWNSHKSPKLLIDLYPSAKILSYDSLGVPSSSSSSSSSSSPTSPPPIPLVSFPSKVINYSCRHGVHIAQSFSRGSMPMSIEWCPSRNIKWFLPPFFLAFIFSFLFLFFLFSFFLFCCVCVCVCVFSMFLVFSLFYPFFLVEVSNNNNW